MRREVFNAIGLGLSVFVGAVAGSFGLIAGLHLLLGIRPTAQLFLVGGAMGFVVCGIVWKMASYAAGEIIAYRAGRCQKASPDEKPEALFR